jgi:hypothetical protein
MRHLISSCLLLVWFGSCHAGDAGISANLYVTAKGRELFHAWETNPAGGFSVVPVKVANRGEFLAAVIFFKECAVGPDGNCNAVVDITAYDPAGKVYGEFKGEELWVGKPAPRPGHTQLSVGYMGLVIEPSDPAGRYKVVATARDLVSGKEATSEATFDVEPVSK